MESLFSTPVPSFLKTLPRIQSADQNELTEIAYEMINVTEHFATDFQAFKASAVMGHDTVQTEDMKHKKSCYKMKIIDLESESLLKVIEFLSVQQINTREINDNTEKFITVKEASKNKKNKLNHQQDYRI